MSRLTLLRSALAICALAAATFAFAKTMDFHVPGGALKAALDTYVKQAGVQLVYKEEDVKGLSTVGVNGALSAEEALEKILEGTKLMAHRDASGAVAIVQASAEGAIQTSEAAEVAGLRLAQADQAMQKVETEKSAEGAKEGVEDSTSSRNDGAEDSQAKGIAEIVVTGTNIRGVYPSSSPVEIYTAEDIERMGVTTLEAFVERLPQNLGSRTQYGTGIDSLQLSRVNRDAVSGVDLRGLGVGTTLTLLNGRRLSPSDYGQAVDISMIPLAAIERVELLTDGASAIYGSDAIGGVVNFVLREDFTGAQAQINYGGVTDGNLRQGNFSQMFGRHWGTGRAVVSYDFHDAEPLERKDRAYARPAGPGTLTPDETRHAVFLTLSQEVSKRVQLSGDFGFSRRRFDTENMAFYPIDPTFDLFSTSDGRSERRFANLALDYRINDALAASLAASYSENDQKNKAGSEYPNQGPSASVSSDVDTNASVLDMTAKIDGELFELPGGSVRFSLGGGVLDEQYVGSFALSSGAPSNREIRRVTQYAFGEVFVPLVGAGQGLSFVRRLELSIAGRYTGYDDRSKPATDQDFGSAVDPKIGLLWAPTQWLGLRGTYGTSFRAPSLSQLDASGAGRFLFPNVVAGSLAQLLFIGGYSDDLQPETAETHTFGFDIQPSADSGFKLSGTYYSIDYSDRIGTVPLGNLSPYANPGLLPDLIYRAQSAAEVEGLLRGVAPVLFGVSLPGVNPSDMPAVAAAIFAQPNLWVYDGRTRNLALSKQTGIDLSVSERFDTPAGTVNFGATVTHILNYDQRASARSSVVSVVDNLSLPVSLRGRFSAGLSRGGFSANLSVNYTDDYKFQTATVGTVPIDSWTTADLFLSYDFMSTGALEGLRISFGATNLFDEAPPYVDLSLSTGYPGVGFDSPNANPLGRLITVGATKRW